jgi:N12 class adenine-specific DNA methylase
VLNELSYRDWSNGDKREFDELAWQNIYDNLPSVPYLSEDQDDDARELFEKGWLTFGEYSKEELDDIRNDFYNAVFVTPDMFDRLGYWEEYRELYSEING